MKKTFTLLAIAAFLTSVSFAQYNQPRNDNYGYNRGPEVVANNHRDNNGYGRGRGTYFFSARERDMQIASINSDYNRRIEFVKHRFFMGREKKESIICSLQAQRDGEIRSVIAKFNDRRNVYDGRSGRDYDHDRRDRW